MKDLDDNSNQIRLKRILKQKILTPKDVGSLLRSGARLLREFLLTRASKVFHDGALEESTLEDIVQDLLLGFEKTRLKEFRGDARLGTFLISCIINRCRTQLVKVRRLPHSNSELLSQHDAAKDELETPAKKLESEDLQQYVIEQISPAATTFVSSLTLEEKTLLRLRYEEKIKWKTIATILGCSEAAAKQRRNRIIKKLRTRVFPKLISAVLEENKDDTLCSQILYRNIVMNQPYAVIAKTLNVKKKDVSEKVDEFSTSFLALIAQPEYLQGGLTLETSVEIEDRK